MRKYELYIGESTDQGGQLILDCSPDNPQGCQIDFDIQQYAASLTVNASITIYNISPYYFSMNTRLINRSIYLYAGMQDTPILQRLGYTGQYGLIASGYITRVIPEWNGNDTTITITFQPFTTPAALETNTTPYELSIISGENIIPKYKAIYKSIGGNEKNLLMGNNPILCTSSYNQKISNISDLNNTLSAQHNGLKLNKTANGYIINTLLNKSVKLAPGDFLMQPAITAINGQAFGGIAMTLILRSDIIMNDIITLPQEVFVGITSLDKGAFTTGDLFQGKTIFSLFHGDYKVTSVWQLGDSRSTDPQGWATIVEGVMN